MISGLGALNQMFPQKAKSEGSGFADLMEAPLSEGGDIASTPEADSGEASFTDEAVLANALQANSAQAGSTQANSTQTNSTQTNSTQANAVPTSPMPMPNFPGAFPGGEKLQTVIPAPLATAARNQTAAGAAAAPASEDGVKDLTRRMVWNDFLRKMKDKLGVGADEILEAFDSLSPEELAQPPIQTVDRVVMALGLDPQATAQAKQFFTELIQKTQPKSLNDELRSSGQQIQLTLMSQREIERKPGLKGIEQMNQSFFGSQAERQKPSNESAPIPKLVSLFDKPKTTNMGQAAFSAGNSGGAGAAAGAGAAGGAGGELSWVPVDPMKGQQNPIPSQVQTPVKSTVDQLIQNFAVPVSASPSPMTPSTANETVMAPAGRVAPLAEFSGHDDADDFEDSMSEEASLLDSSAGWAPTHSTSVSGEFKSHLSAANVTSPLAQPVTVPELVQNAEIMVRDGGGDMKVTLNPEGLGEVAMKVSVDDGKVSVHMVTESDEAKKLIERQLHELKTQLSTNHLQVDSIKIDTASSMGRQLEQQYQDAQRQATQQFMEQFRQDNQGWRRSFFEVPSAKSYKGQAEAPRDIRAPATASSRRSSDRRLDLVA